MKKGEEN